MLHKLYSTFSQAIQLLLFGLLSLSLLLSLFFCFISLLTVKAEATAAYYANCEMQTTGRLYYVNSDSSYTPVRSFEDGIEHTLYFSSAAERAFAIDPYLVNLTESTINGWIGDGYKIKSDLGGYLAVYQPHYTANNNHRDAWAYYEFVPSEKKTDTNMLYRPERNDKYITILCAGGILVTLYCVLKWIRHD